MLRDVGAGVIIFLPNLKIILFASFFRCQACQLRSKTWSCVTLKWRLIGGRTRPITTESVSDAAPPSTKRCVRKTWVASLVSTWRPSRSVSTITWRTVRTSLRKRPSLFTRLRSIGWNRGALRPFSSRRFRTNTTRSCWFWLWSDSKRRTASSRGWIRASVKSSVSSNRWVKRRRKTQIYFLWLTMFHSSGVRQSARGAVAHQASPADAARLQRSGHRVYGLVQPFDSRLWRRTAGEDHRRLFRPVSLVRGWQATTVPSMDQTGRCRASTAPRLQMVSRN